MDGYDQQKFGNGLSKKSMKGNVVYDYVKLEKLPKFSALVDQVDKVLKESSWWELYGVDWTILIFGIIGCLISFWLFKSESYLIFAVGISLLGLGHATLSVKGGHSAAHGTLAKSVGWGKFWTVVFVEFVGSFSAELGHDIHIKGHHPNTNIVGLGDSSTFKAPFLPAYIYMFIAPLCFPIITPIVALTGLFGEWSKLIRCLLVQSVGLAILFSLLMHISGFAFWGAALVTLLSRSLLAIPYIHVNIFQHIGLPMYSHKDRPKKIYQMSTGVLNLSRNLILDPCFGHSIISCHVEHHLFPTLSDNMCLKVKPLVSKFLKVNGLPYNESTYLGRMVYFVQRYKELMVNSPPITHFVGLQ